MTTQPSSPGLEIGLSVRLPRLTARSRRPEDTEAGCRANAAADLGRAGATDTAQGRWRLEHSAASWTKRADLLKRVEAKHEAKLAGGE